MDLLNVFSVSVGAREVTGGATNVSQLRETAHVGHQLQQVSSLCIKNQLSTTVYVQCF